MGENKEYITLPDEKGTINISEEVIAVVAANAALETEFVSALAASLGKDFAERLGKKNVQKGIKLQFNEENQLSVDVYILTRLGCSVSKVGNDVQNNVASAIEAATGITVAEVNVHICGISLDK